GLLAGVCPEQDVVAEAGEVDEAVFELPVAGVLPHLVGQRSRRLRPAEHFVGGAEPDEDPAAVGAPSGDMGRAPLAEPPVRVRDTRVEIVLELVLGRPWRRVAPGPE